ncbi:MAG TPA: DUF4350 domain-containing protein [Candidatus Baltobacteraceae bacterium]|jgi:hypothetical protein|nr:DUF4350 domain-containing protein [Candidatus Baltobacteraceae bacterium]
MKARTGERIALVVGLVLIVAVSIAQHPRGAVSTYSSYDRGPQGYRALFNVLARERVPVGRLETPLGLLDPRVRVVVMTDTHWERTAGIPFVTPDRADVARLRAFAHHGRIVLFASKNTPLERALRGSVVRLDPRAYTNVALARDPQAARRAYDAIAGRGAVVFDERLHGYVVDRSFWSALPPAVHAAAWLALVIVVLLLIDANVRFAPLHATEPPDDRDSSSYIVSMGALLQRARAGRAAIARFASEGARLTARHSLSENAEENLAALHRLAARELRTEGAVLQAARCYAAIRRECS